MKFDKDIHVSPGCIVIILNLSNALVYDQIPAELITFSSASTVLCVY